MLYLGGRSTQVFSRNKYDVHSRMGFAYICNRVMIVLQDNVILDNLLREMGFLV